MSVKFKSRIINENLIYQIKNGTFFEDLISIKFKDKIIKEYTINKLKEIPFFKSLIESRNQINDIIQFNEFNSDIIDDFICNNETINFGKYNFDDLFHAKEFLMLYNSSQIREQFTNQLKNLLLNDIGKINLDNLENYIHSENEYMLSDIINEKPELIQLYPYITSLKCINKNIDLTKFNNLIRLSYYDKDIKTFSSFYNLKTVKELDCSYCFSLEDGCFDTFINLEKLNCKYCEELINPFGNLKKLKFLNCEGCSRLEGNCFNKDLNNLRYLNCRCCNNLQDGFNALINLEKLDCCFCEGLKNPFGNLKSIKTLKCSYCVNLENECFNALINLEELRCAGCNNLKDDCFNSLINLNILDCSECYSLRNPFNINLKNLKKLQCVDNYFEDNCFNVFEHLEELNCMFINFKNPFHENLKTLKKLDCSFCDELENEQAGVFIHLKNLKYLACINCINLEDGCFDVFECLDMLNCNGCPKLKKPFNANLKNLKKLYCYDCINLEIGCFNVFTNPSVLYNNDYNCYNDFINFDY